MENFDLSELRVQYAFAPEAEEKHKQVAQETLSAILHYAMDNKLVVFDCEDSETGRIVPIIAGRHDGDENAGVLPLARIFTQEENVSEQYIPRFSNEPEAKTAN